MGLKPYIAKSFAVEYTLWFKYFMSIQYSLRSKGSGLATSVTETHQVLKLGPNYISFILSFAHVKAKKGRSSSALSKPGKLMSSQHFFRGKDY